MAKAAGCKIKIWFYPKRLLKLPSHNYSGMPDFPIYRKYHNNKAFFKIVSPNSFEEYIIVGKSYEILQIEAKILPEFQMIEDLIKNEQAYWIGIDEKEYDSMKKRCKATLTLMDY